MRHLLDTTEFNKSELEALIALGREMKANPAAFRTGLAGKNTLLALTPFSMGGLNSTVGCMAGRLTS